MNTLFVGHRYHLTPVAFLAMAVLLMCPAVPAQDTPKKSMTVDSLLQLAKLSALYFSPGDTSSVIVRYRMSVFSRDRMSPYMGNDWQKDSFPPDAVDYLKKHGKDSKVFFEYVVASPRSSPGVRRQLPPQAVTLTGP